MSFYAQILTQRHFDGLQGVVPSCLEATHYPWPMWKTALGVGFILSLIAEYAFLTWLVGQIGFASTLVLVLLFIPWGLYLQFSQGQAIRLQLAEAMRLGRPLSDLLAQGALVMAGSVLMIIPGVLSSLLGLLCVLPLTRKLFSPLAISLANRFVIKQIGDPLGPMAGGTIGGMAGGMAGGMGTGPGGMAGGVRIGGATRPGASRPGTGHTQGAGGRRSGYQPGTTEAVQGPGARGASPHGRGVAQGQGGHGQGGQGRGSQSPRKQISAEIIEIERNDRPHPGSGDGR